MSEERISGKIEITPQMKIYYSTGDPELDKKLFNFSKYYIAQILDEHCPIYDGIHPNSDSYRYIIITKKGYVFMKCTHEKCTGRIFPEKGTKMTKEQRDELHWPRNFN